MALNSKFKIPTGRELFEGIRNVRSEWKLQTPMQNWCYLYGIGKAAFRFLRLPLLNDVKNVHWFGYFPMVYLTLLPLLSVYTICYYTFKGELQMGLPSTGAAVISIGHYPLFVVIMLNNQFDLQSLIDFGGKHIYHDNHEKTEYNCSNHMDNTMKWYITKMGTTFTSYLCVFIGPAQAYFIHGIRTTTIETHILFTEPKSDAEFIGNFLLQTMVGVHGILIYIGMELFISILENTVTITPRLVENELMHTIQLYEKKSVTELELHLRIENIVKQSNDADKYLGNFSKLFYWRNLFTLTAFTYAIGMFIYCHYTMAFSAGYGLAIIHWVQLFFFCEIKENMQDNGFDEMLYQTKWEILPINIQKAIMLLIHRKQNEPGLRLGPFGVGINRGAFKVSTNKIYTFVMFLRNFFQ